MPEGTGSFPEIPPQEPISPMADSRWDHDKAETMAQSLKEGVGGRMPIHGDFDWRLMENDIRKERLQEISPESLPKRRQELNEGLARWTDEVLAPFSEFYDLDPERFSAMPTKEFLALAQKYYALKYEKSSLEAAIKEKQEDIKKDTAVLRATDAQIERIFRSANAPSAEAETQV